MATASTTKKPRKRKTKAKEKAATMAETADRFECYQKSVQSPDHEIEIFDQVYREAYRRKPKSLREDFCGTFAVSCEWVESHRGRTAWGIDLCEETLQWGRDNNLSELKASQQKRVQLLQQDVRDGNTPPVDILAAQNFSFWIFKTRREVIDYFKAAYNNLDEKGVMVLDMMGGRECYNDTVTDKRTIVKGKKGFKYHWEQAYFNPVTSDCSFYIHFKFADGSLMERAFEYHWRFWTIPEVREMLAEAGFKRSLVYWEEEDEDGDDTGEWSAAEEAVNNESWLCYIVGVK